MATIVSWPLEEMIISLLMREAPHAGDGYQRRDEREHAPHDLEADRDRADTCRAAPRIRAGRNRTHEIPHPGPGSAPAPV
jgi:hypothetical protein